MTLNPLKQNNTVPKINIGTALHKIDEHMKTKFNLKNSDCVFLDSENSLNSQTIPLNNNNNNNKSLQIICNKISNYNKNLNSFANLLNDKDQIILKTKKENVSNLALEDTNQTNQLGVANMLFTTSTSNLTQNLNKKEVKFSKLPVAIRNKNQNPSLNNTQNNNLQRNVNINNYLKSISKFNTEIANYQHIVYNFNNNHKKLITNIYDILDNSFYSMSSLISKPIFYITNKKVVIHLFYFLNSLQTKSYGSLLKIPQYNKNLQLLALNLGKFLNKPVELELTRIYRPFNDSNILAKLIGLLANNRSERISYRRIVDKIFIKASIKNPTQMINKTRFSVVPSFITGIKIRLAGRLLTQKIIPRISVKTIQNGSLARCKANIVKTDRFTNKNKRGAFSLTVSIGHGFF